MNADLKHRRECLKSGLPVGLPAHIQHDMHRPTGWSRTFGLYFDNAMVRSLGIIEEAETDEEKQRLALQTKLFWDRHHSEGTDAFRDDLIRRAASFDLYEKRFFRVEAAVAHRDAIASELYPDLFLPSSKWVDKDGLVDYRHLLALTKEIQPGVFHEPKRNLLLFAHRFFRRSLSHKNKLNSYFLQSFCETALADNSLAVRLKLDADIIGHPDSAKLLIELEYWHGPMFSDDIASIPNGVAEHKASEKTRHFEGVDRTQIWWKASESRQATDYRTFEAEELIENPSGGLGESEFGCRYAHAEFSDDEAAITHFDGAIRAYPGTQYLDRIDTSIDRAGKYATYTKLFRFDGSLKIASWKRLLSDFFRGNTLIPEYLGAPTELEEENEEREEEFPIPPQPANERSYPNLAAFVSVSFAQIDEPMQLCAEHRQQVGSILLPFVEIGTGEVARYLQTRIDFSDTMAVGFSDDNLNLSRIAFGQSKDVKTLFDDELKSLANAVRLDAEAGVIKRASIPICWNEEKLLITLTILGNASKVACLLDKIVPIIDPTKSAADWVEPLSQLIKDIDPGPPSEISWAGVQSGVLSLERFGVVQQQMIVSDKIKLRLIAEGLLSPEDIIDNSK